MTTTALRPPADQDAGLAPAVSRGPALLAGIGQGPGLAAHRDRVGPAPRPGAEALVEMAREVDLRGRGGAGFPFAIKLAAAAPPGGGGGERLRRVSPRATRTLPS